MSWLDTGGNETRIFTILALLLLAGCDGPGDAVLNTASEAVTTPLTCYLPFDEGEGTVALDQAPIAVPNNAALKNGASWTAQGTVDHAVSLDGVDDYLSLGAGDFGLCDTDEMTLSTWVKVNGFPEGYTPATITQRGRYVYPFWLRTYQWQYVDVRIRTESGTHYFHSDSHTLPMGEWTHIAVTYDGQAASLYINGVLKKSIPLTGALNCGAGLETTIGKIPDEAAGYFNGSIDEYRIFNTALTPEAIVGLANQCPEGRTGESCEACLPGYFGEDCDTYCDSTDTCNGAGTCSADGDCVCDSGWIGPHCETPGSVDYLIVVSSPLKETGRIDDALDDYVDDIQAVGWHSKTVTVNTVDDGAADAVVPTPEALKALIASYYKGGEGIDGFVFIGSEPAIPTAWWHYHTEDHDWRYGRLPSDLFYSDMDEWVDVDGDGIYESYLSVLDPDTGEWAPDTTAPVNPAAAPISAELFSGRIDAGAMSASIDEEAAYVAAYLEKIHDYRRDGSQLTPEQLNRTLLFQDDDFTGKNQNQNWRHMTANLVGVYDISRTTADTLAEEMTRGYRFALTAAHSGADAHQTHEWSGDTKIYGAGYNLDRVRDIDAAVNYVQMFNCSANNFSVPNLGAMYLFENQHPLNVAGSVGNWGFMGDETYFQNLADGHPVGVALLSLVQRTAANGETGWPKGILQGDPLIAYGTEQVNMPPFITTDLRNITASEGVVLSLVFETEDPENDAVTIEITSPLPSGADFDGQTFTWLPGAEHVGYQTTELSLLATDIHGNTYRETIDMSVFPSTPVAGWMNGDFELGPESGVVPDDWQTTMWKSGESIMTWEPVGEGRDGSRCISIESDTANDAAFIQMIDGLVVGEDYVLSGWVKGEDIGPTASVGANFSINGTWSHSTPPLVGTFDWRPVSFAFEATDTAVTLAARLGFWGSTVSGKVWFDDLMLFQLADM